MRSFSHSITSGDLGEYMSFNHSNTFEVVVQSFHYIRWLRRIYGRLLFSLHTAILQLYSSFTFDAYFVSRRELKISLIVSFMAHSVARRMHLSLLGACCMIECGSWTLNLLKECIIFGMPIWFDTVHLLICRIYNCTCILITDGYALESDFCSHIAKWNIIVGSSIVIIRTLGNKITQRDIYVRWNSTSPQIKPLSSSLTMAYFT